MTMTDPLIVETTGGAVKGERGNGVYIWRGIPYASTPEGGLRFRKPERVKRWEGVRDAADFGPMCAQTRSMKGRAAVSSKSEDCQTLNIWSPEAGAEAGAGKRPVLFYIHGGSFAEGAGSDPEYEGTNLALAGDIVVVTVNYRLAVFGFMDFSFFGEEFTRNCGLFDILEALRWVNENIEAFGGDAGNVTVCGQSAGATCACILPLFEDAKEYMKRIIMMSGVPVLLHKTEEAQKIARRFLEFMDIADADALLNTPEQVIGARQKEFCRVNGLGAATYAPCVDGESISKYPISLALEGKTGGVPALIGTTRDEMSIVLFKRLSKILDVTDMRRMGVQSETDEAKRRISKAYEKYGKRSPAVMMSDLVFHMPCIWYAEARNDTADTWMYSFDYETFGMRVSGLRAFHSSDIPFLFGNFRAGLSRYMMALSPYKKGIREVYHELRGDFLTFMKTGELPWEKCEGGNTPAKRYARTSFTGHAISPEVKRVYEGSEYKRRSIEGDSITSLPGD